MEGFCFEKSGVLLKTDDTVFCARIGSTKTREELFQELNKKLFFPPYFGYNWDALYDLYTDFHWINQKTILIVHEGVNRLPTDVLKAYMDIISDTLVWWERYPDHEVCFYI